MGQEQQIKVGIVCADCGQSGPAMFDEGSVVPGTRRPEIIMPMSQGFYLRMPRGLIGPMEVVCSKCGGVLD